MKPKKCEHPKATLESKGWSDSKAYFLLHYRCDNCGTAFATYGVKGVDYVE